MKEEQTMSDHNGPQTSQPMLPKGYGIPEELLPWSFARERLEQAQNCWLCTVGASGKPHATPLWGVWLDDRFYFEGSPLTRWGRNIAANWRPSMNSRAISESSATLSRMTIGLRRNPLIRK